METLYKKPRDKFDIILNFEPTLAKDSYGNPIEFIEELKEVKAYRYSPDQLIDYRIQDLSCVSALRLSLVKQDSVTTQDFPLASWHRSARLLIYPDQLTLEAPGFLDGPGVIADDRLRVGVRVKGGEAGDIYMVMFYIRTTLGQEYEDGVLVEVIPFGNSQSP